MKIHVHSFGEGPTYSTHVQETGKDDYIEKQIAFLCKLIVEHPEDEEYLLQQLLV